MGKSIKTNYVYNLLYEVVAILIPVITTPYVSRVLGATAIGDYSYTVGIVSYFGIVAATGTRNYGQREIAVCQNNRHNRSVVFWEIFAFRAICTLGVTIIYLLFLMNFMKQYQILFLIHFLTVISWVVDVSWFFQGMENFKVTALRNSAVKIVGTIMIFVFVKSSEDLWIYTLIYSATNLAGNLSMWTYIKDEIKIPSLKEIHILKHIKGIMALFIPVIAMQVYTILDKTMLGALCNTTEVGYYSQAEKIVKLALAILSSFVAVLAPRISLLYNQGNMDKIEKYYKEALEFIFFLATPMMFGCCFFADIFVPVFFGTGYESVVGLMQILSLLFIVLSIGQLLGNFLVAMKMQKYYSIAVTTAAIVNIILNYMFIVIFDLGAIGVSCATVIAEAVSTLIQITVMKEHLKIKYIIVYFVKYLIPSIAMISMSFVIRLLELSNIATLFLSVFFAVAVYFGILAVLKDEILWGFIMQLKRKITACINK